MFRGVSRTCPSFRWVAAVVVAVVVAVAAEVAIDVGVVAALGKPVVVAVVSTAVAVAALGILVFVAVVATVVAVPVADVAVVAIDRAGAVVAAVAAIVVLIVVALTIHCFRLPWALLLVPRSKHLLLSSYRRCWLVLLAVSLLTKGLSLVRAVALELCSRAKKGNSDGLKRRVCKLVLVLNCPPFFLRFCTMP